MSRGTDYDDGYTMINHQTQTEVSCKCFTKGLVNGKTWDDDVMYVKSLTFKKNELKERCKGKGVEYLNRIHIPTLKDKERIR